MRIFERESSSNARWSLRLALFAAQLLLVTVLLHRFADFATPPTINLMVLTLALAAVSILLATLAFIRIWNTGIEGTGLALTGMLISSGILLVPLYHLPNLLRLPAIDDVTTDLLSPPQFEKIVDLREPGANPTGYPGPQFIARQASAYPDIATLTLERGAPDAYELVRDVVADLGWQVVGESAPQGGGGTGSIEAVDRSLLLGFRDDVVIRVVGERAQSRIDMRSASRYGRHDLGANANRIRELFGLVKNRIARAEARKLDALERERIAEKIEEQRQQRELERQQMASQTAGSEPAILPPARFGSGSTLGAEPLPMEDPELAVGDEPAAAGAGTRASGFDIIDTVRRGVAASKAPSAGSAAAAQQQGVSQQTQKIRASKRKRWDSWIPFDMP